MTQRIKNLSAGNILLLAVCYSVLVTVLLLMPVNSTRTFNFPIDKLVHVCIHLGFIICWAWVAQKKKILITQKHWIVLFVLCVVYGILIEVLQEHLTVSRSADFWDVIANTVGSSIGMFFFHKRNLFFQVKDQ